MAGAANRVVLEGRLVDEPDVRWTPAGLPLARFTLEHRSRVTVAGLERVVRCRVTIVALGEALVERARALTHSASCRVEGILAQRVRQWRDEEPLFGRIEVHATELIAEEPDGPAPETE